MGEIDAGANMNIQSDEFKRSEHLDRIREFPCYRALPPLGRSYVEAVLQEPPARRAGATSLLSVSGSYATERFPYLVDYESAGYEKAFVLNSILDATVIDLLSQPRSITLARTDRRGRKRPTSYTPDYLEIKADTISLVEVKPKGELLTLVASDPDWYESDGWHYGPAEEAISKMGLAFYVFCPDEMSPIRRANLEVLAKFSGDELTRREVSAINRAKRHLEARPRTILELCSRYQAITASVIYRAIRAGLLHGLIDRQHLEQEFIVYATNDEAGEREAFLNRERKQLKGVGPMHDRLLRASAKELNLARRAMERFDDRRSNGKKLNATDYRDKKSLKLASAESAPRLAAFLRRVGDRGGRAKHIDPAVVERIGQHARKYLAEAGVPNQSKMYADFVVCAEQEGLYVPSQETHRREILGAIGPDGVAMLAGGRRAFHAARPPVDGADAVSRPRISGLWVHIDGVLGDVRSKKDESGDFTRPIFYPMIDDHSGYVPGLGIRFGRPSRLPVLMAHRDCYLRHGFLPFQILEDWGSEFENLLIPEMRAQFSVSYAHRPVGAPRFAGIGETFNGIFSAFLQNLAGGTYFDKKGRAADGKRKSRSTASLTTREIIDQAASWVFNVWNKYPVGPQTKSPEQLWKESISCFPEGIVPVTNDIISRYYTSLPLNAAQFSYSDGFRFNSTRFTSADLPRLIRQGEIPTNPRLDCMNPSIAYAQTSSGVIELRSLDYKRFEGMSFDRRMHEMEMLLNARTRSKSNQLARNKAEARSKRECVGSEVAPSAHVPKTAPTGRTETEQIDFSTVKRGEAERLQRAN